MSQWTPPPYPVTRFVVIPRLGDTVGFQFCGCEYEARGPLASNVQSILIEALKEGNTPLQVVIDTIERAGAMRVK